MDSYVRELKQLPSLFGVTSSTCFFFLIILFTYYYYFHMNFVREREEE